MGMRREYSKEKRRGRKQREKEWVGMRREYSKEKKEEKSRG